MTPAHNLPLGPRRGVNKPCRHCNLTLADFWIVCPHCELLQSAPTPPDWYPSARVRTKIIERQLVEAMPELHEKAWRAMSVGEQLLWLWRMSPEPPAGVSVRIVMTCDGCGKALTMGGCLECGTGMPARDESREGR